MKILVVDEQHSDRKSLKCYLNARGCSVVEANNASSALKHIADRPDLVILEPCLPDLDGLKFVKSLRDMGCRLPIFIWSRLQEETTKIQAFELGADDYLVKPFSAEEMFARIKAAYRRNCDLQATAPLFTLDALSVDLVRRIVKVNDLDVDLTPKEYDILSLLTRYAGKVVTQGLLLEKVWTSDTDPQYLRTYIRQLRRKIEPLPADPYYITTVNGVGYRLRAPG